jgi:hypothetical protein
VTQAGRHQLRRSRKPLLWAAACFLPAGALFTVLLLAYGLP